MRAGKLLGLILVIAAIGTFVFYGYAASQIVTWDKEQISLFIMCSLPPLGGLAGGIACLTEKDTSNIKSKEK